MDRTGLPFVGLAALPAAIGFLMRAPILGLLLLALPIGIGLFFRDPERTPPDGRDLVLSPADGTVMFAGEGRPAEAPPGAWRQITIFLSPLDVHINRTPVSGRVTRVDYHAGSFRPAYRADAHQNERSEIWFDHDGQPGVARQVVGALARRVVCRLKPGDGVSPGAGPRVMKFGSRMDVFPPASATLSGTHGARA